MVTFSPDGVARLAMQPFTVQTGQPALLRVMTECGRDVLLSTTAAAATHCTRTGVRDSDGSASLREFPRRAVQKAEEDAYVRSMALNGWQS